MANDEMRNNNDCTSISPESCASQLKTLQTQQQYTSIRHILKSNKCNGDWMKEFIAHAGFHNLHKNITLVCLPENRPNNAALSSLVACVSVVMATRHGLDAATTSPSTLNSLILGLISDDELVKRDILTLLATLTLHSSSAYKIVIQSFNHFKRVQHVTYRFGALVDDLKHTESVEYQKSLLNFINCLIDRSTIPDKRIDLRNEIIALGLLDVLKHLRTTQNSSVAQQIVHFYEQKAKDEMKFSPALDVSDPPAMFTLLWRKIAKTPRSNDLMKIVQKLLFTVDTSDLWSAAIEALSGPRTTQGAFKDSQTSAEQNDDKDRFPEPPESPVGHSPSQHLEWRAVEDSTLEHSVWARVNLRQNSINIRNIGNYFYQTCPDKPRLRYICEEKAVSLNLLLASVNNNNRNSAIETLTSCIIDGDTSLIPEITLRRLANILPQDPNLFEAASLFSGNVESLDSSELLLVSISRIPDFQTRLKCLLGELSIPGLLKELEVCEDAYASAIAALLNPNSPILDLLRLVLDIGNCLNEDGLVKGFKLGALNQLKMMRAPRQPSLTLLHFVTQSLSQTHPETLSFIVELRQYLEECKKKTMETIDEELRNIDTRLREIRSLLVISSKDVKLRFTESVVDAGKRVTNLKNRRKLLGNRINDLAEFYCESRVDFSISSYLDNLLVFCCDVMECKEVVDLAAISDNKCTYLPELKIDSFPPREEALFSRQLSHRTNTSSITSAYSSRRDTDSDSGYQGRRETYESEYSRRESCDTVFSSRRGTHETDVSAAAEPVGISLESRLNPGAAGAPPKPKRPVGVILDSSKEFLFQASDHGHPEADPLSPIEYNRAGDLKRMHANYRSMDLTRSRSHDYYDRYHSVEYRAPRPQEVGPYNNGRRSTLRSVEGYKDRYRHSPPTREQDDECQSDGSSTDSEPSLRPPSRSEMPMTRSEEPAERSVLRGESRTVGHAASASMVPPVSYLNSTFGGSCRGLQSRGHRTDVRDIFASKDRLANDRYGSSNSINIPRQKLPRGSNKHHPQQSSIQAMLRGDQNSNAVKREPPPIPKREPIVGGGMGKKENSRSTPALYSPYSRSPNFSPTFSSSTGGTMSPPEPHQAGTLSPPHPGTLSPPHPGTLSPPHPGTLSPPTRYSRDRPFSAGTNKKQLLPSLIDEDGPLEVHHERQSSEPADTRRAVGGLVKANLSASSSEISGVETEV